MTIRDFNVKMVFSSDIPGSCQHLYFDGYSTPALTLRKTTMQMPLMATGTQSRKRNRSRS